MGRDVFERFSKKIVVWSLGYSCYRYVLLLLIYFLNIRVIGSSGYLGNKENQLILGKVLILVVLSVFCQMFLNVFVFRYFFEVGWNYDINFG